MPAMLAARRPGIPRVRSLGGRVQAGNHEHDKVRDAVCALIMLRHYSLHCSLGCRYLVADWYTLRGPRG